MKKCWQFYIISLSMRSQIYVVNNIMKSHENREVMFDANIINYTTYRYTGSFFGSGGGNSTNDGTFRLTADPDWDAVNGYTF